MKTIIHFVIKEVQQFKRDPKMFGIILIAPVIQLIFLGYAANLDVENVKAVVYDQCRTLTSREFIERFTSSGYFEITDYVSSYNELEKKLNNGEAILALVIPRDFEKNISRKESAPLQAIFEGSDGNQASIAAGYVQMIVSKYSKLIIADFMNLSGRKNIPAGSISAEVRVWYNPEMKTRNYMVPGIVGLLVSLVTLVLTSLAIVKEKEIGTMEQLIVTPIKPYQLIAGKLIPFTILGLISVIIVLLAMRIIFEIPVKGSEAFLLLSAFLYILSTLGLGLFISTISKNQQQAMMIAVFAVMMPMIFLSGFAFPIENMPQIIQFISYIIPLKYFNIIIRGVILKGLGFTDLWFEALTLLIMGATILFLSAKRFNKKIE
ncbi:MAG: ABC transporter permease [Ignavibacteriaceae bacterium]|nr:ABC transporter permease [Ignavibacteriaceae bacterium]